MSAAQEELVDSFNFRSDALKLGLVSWDLVLCGELKFSRFQFLGQKLHLALNCGALL